ncbi:hypothetical protein BGW36DRAFT_291595 [Talaromyces proteolyticus]|uniref:Uncharacterized protein n=1 Tax=Talaromyces proteolyticus TaxID=1131652 RepID=A0AAD4Q2N1_9EURO|nr:uncharacterized protein BGW36DRAFT_291595 [Talaromyces proteolyticus]KAH8700582.1 hypothetical protein BGW36DRAFT_291595 [Talaromyces proteolyticus]
MAHHQHSDSRRGPTLYHFLKMVFSTDSPTLSAGQDVEVIDDGDEPPDRHPAHHISPAHSNADRVYVKSPPTMMERKESLLTRALLRSPDLGPTDRSDKASYPISNASGHSTAELTSDGDLTSPAYSNTSSPPHLQTLHLSQIIEPKIVAPPSDPSESKVEADLGRKRCISFACARRADRPKESEKNNALDKTNVSDEPPKRKTTLTFACPSRNSDTKFSTPYRRSASQSRPRGSPAPASRHRISNQDGPAHSPSTKEISAGKASKKPGSIHTSGLGDFQPSEETRFHEFASSLEEVDEWMVGPTEHKEKITLNDCMKKENAIRRLGEEAEAEAIEEEEEEEDLADGDDDGETIHDFSSDDGNESDNEAGFADSDDESDDNSEYEFWAPSTTTAATSADNMDFVRLDTDRRNSNTSLESLKRDTEHSRFSAPSQIKKGRRPINIPRTETPDLPDSTDFVCGTLDEDRPLEAAYISAMEERRRKKHVPIPQDIDPSFPATDPEDQEDDDLEEENAEDEIMEAAAKIEEELLRGRRKGPSRTSPRISPRRVHSPAPRKAGQISPKRLKSPAPKSAATGGVNLPVLAAPVPATGVNITGPVRRPHYSRTKSLPRTPNPFFLRLEKSRQSITQASSRSSSPERAISRGRELHTRGPIDIIQGLERKRQKRKEKFWRQHCRKTAKEQTERRTKHGKGAERMKELGLEVAERFKAYGVTKDTQLVLSV